MQSHKLKNNSIQDNSGNSIFISNPKLINNSVQNQEMDFDEENRQENEEEKESKSSLELFFDSMAQTVKKLPTKVQADIKMNICRIVTEAEVRFSNRLLENKDEDSVPQSGLIPKLVLIPCSMIDK